jgi:succinyl-diaminopimelate desuccinylase
VTTAASRGDPGVEMIDAIDLTRRLIGFDTANPPGREGRCATFLAEVLESAGFEVQVQSFADDRANLVASLPGRDSARGALVLTGHLDTVPLGASDWTVDPFGGEIAGGLIHGRGASDMKAGVGAMVAAAARRAASGIRLRRGLTLIFTSGEETGCAGALQLLHPEAPALGSASAMIVGEPTANRISTGHKGCLALTVRARGVTAHSSMPQLGVNAIYAAARAIGRIEHHRLAHQPDALLGSPSLNVGTISGGMNYNSVPDAAEFTLDVRTIPAMDHDALEEDLRRALGSEVSTQRLVDMPAVGTARDDPFVQFVFATSARILGPDSASEPIGLPFFSDASVLTPRFACPTVILGPGEPSMAHQTDESCRLDRLLEAVELYDALIAGWCE